jgi:intracellular septation protein
MIKFLSEIGPVLAFILGFIYGDIYVATLYTIVASLVSISLCYLIEGKLQPFSLISSVILIVSGSITLLTGNPMFIKMKPTILYIIFGAVFFISTRNGKPFMKFLFQQIFTFNDDKYWNILSWRFSYFFFGMAILNEIVWRSFSDLIWVEFKVFGVLPITFLFMLLQVPMIMKNKIDKN